MERNKMGGNIQYGTANQKYSTHVTKKYSDVTLIYPPKFLHIIHIKDDIQLTH